MGVPQSLGSCLALVLVWALGAVQAMDTTVVVDVNVEPEKATLDVLTCPAVQKIDHGEIESFLNEWNKNTSNGMPPYSLLHCLKEKLAEHVATLEVFAMDEVTPNTVLDRLETDLAHEIGVRLLATFELEEFESMSRRELMIEHLAMIGELSMDSIMYTMSNSKFKALSKLLWGELNKDQDAHKLSFMGSLLHADADIIQSVEADELKTLLSSAQMTSKGVCLNKAEMIVWGNKLEEIFGEVRLWTEPTFLALGDLLLTLSKAQWEKVSVRKFRFSAETLLEHSALLNTYDEPPLSADSRMSFRICRDWLPGDDGEYFEHATITYLRHLLRASQLNAEDASNNNEDESGPSKRSILDIYELFFGSKDDLPFKSFRIQEPEQTSSRRVRRQALKRPIGPQFTFKLITRYFEAVLLFANKRKRAGSITNAQNSAIVSAIAESTQDAAKEIQELLELDYLPTLNMSSVYNEVKKNDSVPANVTSHVANIIIKSQLNITQSIAEILDVEPRDLDDKDLRSDSQFCIYLKGTNYCRKADLNPENWPDALTCKGLQLAGARLVAIALQTSDIQSWTKEELELCVPFFGTLDLSYEKKDGIVTILGQKEALLYNQEDLSKLGSLLETIVHKPEGLEKLNLNNETSVDVIFNIGLYAYPSELLTNITERIGASARFEDTSSRVHFYGSLGNLICGLRNETLEKVLDTDEEIASMLITRFGKLEECQNPDLVKIMARKAVEIYGPPSDWQPSLVKSLGLILASIDEPSQLSEESIAALGIRTVSHADKAFFQDIINVNATKLNHLTPEAIRGLIDYSFMTPYIHAQFVKLKDTFPGTRWIEDIRDYNGPFLEPVVATTMPEPTSTTVEDPIVEEVVGPNSTGSAVSFSLSTLLVFSATFIHLVRL